MLVVMVFVRAASADAGWCSCAAAGSHPVGRNRPAQASLLLSCKYMFQLFQTFQRHIAIVSYGCCKSRSRDVASVSEACCQRLFKLFHLFLDVCCRRFDLDVAYVFTHILQQYVPKCFICFSLLLQVFSYCKLQVFNLDVAYVFTHMLQVYVLNVSPVSNVCSRCFIWMLHSYSGYTHMLQTYVLIVSPYFSTLQQVLLLMCSDLRAKHALHQAPQHHQVWSPTVEHAAGSTPMHARYAPSLSLALGARALCSLSRIGARAL
jgi:hypothetical protein